MAHEGRWAGGTARTVACLLLAVAGALLAVGAVFNLWLQSLNFGGPEGSPDITGEQVVGHLLIVAAGVLVPLAVARALLGRVRSDALLAAAALGVALGAAVLGLSA